MLVCAAVLTIWMIVTQVVSTYRFEKNYSQLWELADKSSTIPAKQQYISKFVSALEAGYANGEFSRHDAIWLTTPNNSFEANLTALKSLASRLEEIQGMNPSSFEYNTAIQQITAQEQGESRQLLNVINGCYELKNYPIIWKWIGGTLCVVVAVLAVGACIWLFEC